MHYTNMSETQNTKIIYCALLLSVGFQLNCQDREIRDNILHCKSLNHSPCTGYVHGGVLIWYSATGAVRVPYLVCFLSCSNSFFTGALLLQSLGDIPLKLAPLAPAVISLWYSADIIDGARFKAPEFYLMPYYISTWCRASTIYLPLLWSYCYLECKRSTCTSTCWVELSLYYIPACLLSVVGRVCAARYHLAYANIMMPYS